MHKAGNIVLVPFPFTDLSGSKVRPALILSHKIISDDVVVAFISTNQKKKGKFSVTVKKDNKNKLKADSTILVAKIATLEKKIILGEIGQLSDTHMEQVRAKLKYLFL